MLRLGKKDSHILIFVYIAFILANILIFKTYFIQDEWNGVGRNLYLIGEGYSALIKDIFTYRGFLHFNPITRTYSILNTVFWGSSNLGFSFWVFILAFLNIYVLLKFLNLFIEENHLVKLLTITFFMFSHVSYQTYFWSAQSFSIQGSFIFVNLSLLAFIHFVRNDERKYLLISIFLFLFSTLFKETGVGLLPLFPLSFWFFRPGKFSKSVFLQGVKILFAFISTSLLFFFIPRFLTVNSSNVTSSGLTTSLYQVCYNLFTLPLKALSQVFFQDSNILYFLSEKFLDLEHGITLTQTFGNRYDFMVYYLATATLSYVFSILIIFILLIFIYTLYKSKNFLHMRIILWCLAYFFLSFVPFSFQTFHNIFLDSRYYYIGVFPFSLILSLGIYHLNILIKSNDLFRNTVRPALLFFVSSIALFYLSLNIYSNYLTLRNVSQSTSARRDILEFMKIYFSSSLEGDFILYIEDINHPNQDPSYINITGHYFQTGILYPFLVYNYKSGLVSPKYFKDDLLWSLDFQGIRKEEGKKVGIFYEKDKLYSGLKNGNFKVEDVYSITFDYSGLKDCGLYSGRPIDLVCASYFDSTGTLRNKLNDLGYL